MAEKQYLRISIDQELEDSEQPDKVMRSIPEGYSQFNGLITELHIPLVKSIGNGAFRCAVGLESIELPIVETIGDAAFLGCSKAAYVNAPRAKRIGNNAFQGCSEAITMDFGSGVTGAGYNAFAYCSKLESINLPSLKRIQENAFASCKKLKYATFSKATSIEDRAFERCTSLAGLTFPSVNAVNGSAFLKCTTLKVVELPSITSISQGSKPFEGCRALEFLGLSGITAQYPPTDIFTDLNALKLVNLQNVGPDGVVLGTYEEGRNHQTICNSADIVCNQGVFHNGLLWKFETNYASTFQPHPNLKYGDPEIYSITSVLPRTDFGGTLYDPYADGISTKVAPPFAGREDISRIYLPRAISVKSKPKAAGAFEGCINLEHASFHAISNLAEIGTNTFKDTPLKYLYIGRVTDISTIKAYIDGKNPWALPEGCTVACPGGVLVKTSDGTEIL